MKGRLHFTGWNRQWIVVEDDGQLVDIAPLFWDFAEAHKGAGAELPYSLDSIGLVLVADAMTAIDFDERGSGILISESDGACFKNVMAYLCLAFERLNGRQVTVTADGTKFEIAASPSEDVPQVFYIKDGGNEGRIPDDAVIDRCRIGFGADCCIFLTSDPNGFTCSKFGGLSRVLLERHAAGQMAAGRIGNCRLAGREKAS